MRPRITVPGIFGMQFTRRIFSPQETVVCCYSNPELVLLGTHNKLLVYELPNFQLLDEYPLTSAPMKIVQHARYFLVLCGKDVKVHCLEWVDSKLYANSLLEGHLLTINDLIGSNESEVVTCSDDFTVRLWQGEEPFSTSKILSGHQGKVRCLESYREYIFSGSSEREVFVWKGRKLFHQLKASSEVDAMMSCLEADYLAVVTKSTELEMYDLRSLKNRKLPLLYTVRLPSESTLSCRKRLFQLDEHFIVVIRQSKISFIEIYMKQLIRTVTTSNNTQIVNVTPINSMVVFADQQHLYLEDLCL